MAKPTTLTSNGRVTVPREIRDRLGLKAGDKLTFALLSDGTMVMRAKTKRLSDLAAMLTRTVCNGQARCRRSARPAPAWRCLGTSWKGYQVAVAASPVRTEGVRRTPAASLPQGSQDTCVCRLNPTLTTIASFAEHLAVGQNRPATGVPRVDVVSFHIIKLEEFACT
jgi:antitoxin PrlF